MIKSMTGFATRSSTIENFEIKVEIKSVNSRYLDIHVKGGQLNLLQEKRIREIIKQYVNRGRIDIFFEMKSESLEEYKINKNLLLKYKNDLDEISKELSISSVSSISELLLMPEIFKREEDEEKRNKIFEKSIKIVEEALQDLIKMRSEEGKNLYRFIKERLLKIIQNLNHIEKNSKEILSIQFEKMKNKLNKLLRENDLEEKLILEIAAISSDRFDISEELERFKSHIEQFEKTLEENGPGGKKLDFLIQEMNREINTLLSKTDLTEVKKFGIEIKTELEKIREQVQNIE